MFLVLSVCGSRAVTLFCMRLSVLHVHYFKEFEQNNIFLQIKRFLSPFAMLLCIQLTGHTVATVLQLFNRLQDQVGIKLLLVIQRLYMLIKGNRIFCVLILCSTLRLSHLNFCFLWFYFALINKLARQTSTFKLILLLSSSLTMLSEKAGLQRVDYGSQQQ